MLKASFIALVFIAVSTLVHATSSSTAKEENGMQAYYIGFLSRGERWTSEQTEQTRALQAGHMQHIQDMAKSGKLLIAGPFMYEASDTDQNLRGIFIFDVATLEQAQALATEDPSVKAGRLKIEFRKWYGPVGLTYRDHKKYFDGAPVAPEKQ
jgi:uncharacterized protein YciI